MLWLCDQPSHSNILQCCSHLALHFGSAIDHAWIVGRLIKRHRSDHCKLPPLQGIDHRDQWVWDLCATFVLDHHSNSIQLHLSSVNMSFHLYDFSQQNKIHVTPIFLGARVNWFQIRCSLSFRSSTPAGGSIASSMIPANPATAEVALFLSDRFFIEYLHRSSDTESILVRYFSSYTTV